MDTTPSNSSPSKKLAQPNRSGGSFGLNVSGLSQQSPGDASASLLSNIDFKAIDEMDPSLSDGHKVYFDKDIPLELRAQDTVDSNSQSVGTLEAIRVKILTLGEDNQLYDVRVELTSESDLFFHYTHSCDRNVFTQMKKSQDLMVDYNNYPKILAKMLMSCIKDPEAFLCIFVIGRDGNAQMTFVQNMEYKFVELLTLEFTESPEHIIRQSISFRYNSLKSRLAVLTARLQDISALIKLKNPSLLLQLQRNVHVTQPVSPQKSSGISGNSSLSKKGQL
jgi:hypothetical protein